MAINCWCRYLFSRTIQKEKVKFKMTYITIKTKKTNANVEIYPPIVLDGRSHISLVDIIIPEEVTKSFIFTGHQAISGEPTSKDNQSRLMAFPKGVYNIHKFTISLTVIRRTKILG